MQTALITGASSGIGLEFAKILAQKGHSVILVARNKKKLKTVAHELQKQHDVSASYIAMDLAKPGSALKLHKKTKKDNVGILINNAGFGLKGDFFTNNPKDHYEMAHLNMVSLMELCQLYGLDFRKKGEGKILNVSSIVSFIPGPKQPVYYASKAFVRSLSRSLAYNLRDSGVTVTALHPGVTKTNFFKAANVKSIRGGASPQSVAELGYKAMMRGKAEVTHGTWNKLLTNVFVRLVPYKLHAKLVDLAADA